MAISINWGLKIIYVPQADMTLIQSVPTEIRELDINWFRLQLKDLEDDEAGIAFPTTHRHVPPFTFGGVSLARAVEIINDYTVTFEDNQYAVNLIGANSNIGDRVNVNQVSVRSANSAGLVTSAAIEFGEYGGAVTVDVDNGVAGTIYPIGTLRSPCNNIPDANLIAAARGFSKIKLISNLTLSTGDSIEGFDIEGISPTLTVLTVEDAALTARCEITNCSVTGVLDGETTIAHCNIGDLTYFNGQIHHCMLLGTIVLDGDSSAHIHGCFSGLPGLSEPIIDMGGSGNSLGLRDYAGGIRLINKTGIDPVSIDFSSGNCILGNTVTAGLIVCRGVGTLMDELGNHIPTGTWNGVTIYNDSMSKGTIAESVWDEDIINHTQANTTGYEALLNAYDNHVHVSQGAGSGTSYPHGTKGSPVGTIADALIIAQLYGIDRIHIEGEITIAGGEDISGYVLIADRSLGNRVTVTSAITASTYFENLTVSGTMNGSVRYTTCVMGAIANFDGGAKNSLLTGDITIVGNGANYFTECDTYITDSALFKQLDVGDKLLNIIRCRGNYEISNKTGSTTTSIDITAGQIKIDSGCTAGEIYVDGIGAVTDESGAGCSVITTNLQGLTLEEIRKLTANNAVKVGNTLNIYDDDGVVVWRSYNLANEGRVVI